MGIAFTKAINRYTDHQCHLITTTTRYNFGFEKDIHIPDVLTQMKGDSVFLEAIKIQRNNKNSNGFDEIRDLLTHADIIHFHILVDENIELGPIKVKDYIKRKALIHHHHGHPDFRSNPGKYRDKYRKLNRKVLVSTPDLLLLIPEASWQPNLVPIDAPLYLPFQNNMTGKTRICQSPTRKDLKNTVEFREVVTSLKQKYHNLEIVIIEDTAHKDCLKIKQTCDIHFDHMQGYFGVSSLEGLSQGKPVIAGLDEWNIQCIKKFVGSEELPWIIARNQDELENCLENLNTSSELRKKIGRESRYFMERYWNEKQVIGNLIDAYREL